jgi:dsRNA-specific ribonuclease
MEPPRGGPRSPKNLLLYAAAEREPFSQSGNWVLSSSCAVHDQIIGKGNGVSIDNAKNMAAFQAMQYLGSLLAKHPLFSQN